MNAEIAGAAQAWLGVAFAFACVAVGVAAATARTLFAMVIYLCACGVFGAGALLAQQQGEAALSLALFAAGFAPVLLLAVLLLATRAARCQAGAPAWVTLVCVAAAGAALFWALPDFGAAAQIPHERGAGMAASAAWLAPLLFVAATSALALLGFGERGAYGAHHADAREAGR